MLQRLIFLGLLLIFGWFENSYAQTIPAGFPLLEDYARRKNILGSDFQDYSFALRPIKSSSLNLLELQESQGPPPKDSTIQKSEKKHLDFSVLPVLTTTVFNSNRPFGWGNTALLHGAGFQNLTSAGFFFKFRFLEIQLRPEFVLSQNRSFQGYSGGFSDEINFARFRSWNFGDHPEFFPEEFNKIFAFGQSYFSLNFGKLELGVGSQNIWWGPGQFTSLIFSNNARGMPHAFFKTSGPVKIGIGHLEAQVIAGKAEDSGVFPSQNQALNSSYFWPFSGDWRYVNGISMTFQPKFLKGFFLGFNRTFQQYEKKVEDSFSGRFPVFQAIQKEKFFDNGNTVDYDGQAQDQQVSVFLKYRGIKGRFELYAEYGKNDHNLNWREFNLNPEHARAYLFGFTKIFPLTKPQEFIQVKGEIIHQSESVNRYIRYPVLGVLNTSWHTHYQVRGFTNFGESMGTGIGVGSNAQIMEISKVKNLNRAGIIFQRIENQKDFFMRARDLNPQLKPWVDFSLGFLWDYQFKRLVVGSNVQLIRSLNYQWKQAEQSSIDFPLGENLNSFSGSLHLIYLLDKK